MEERRKEQRIHTNWNVYSNDKYIPGKIGIIHNISKSGAKLIIEKGTVDSIHIHHGSFNIIIENKIEDKKIEINAKPIWIRVTENDNYHIGLRFFDNSKEDINYLGNLIDKYHNDDKTLQIKALLIFDD